MIVKLQRSVYSMLSRLACPKADKNGYSLVIGSMEADKKVQVKLLLLEVFLKALVSVFSWKMLL